MIRKFIVSTLLTLVVTVNAFAAAPISSGFVKVDGGKLYYQQFGNKHGKPIIVLHGGPGLDSSYLLPQMAKLGKTNNLVTFYDQRGSGKSLNFALDEKSINMPTFVKDLDAVRNKLGNEKAIILGHSWGAILAMNYAVAFPQHVEALILVSGGPANSDGFKIFFEEYTRRIEPIKPEITAIESSKPFKYGEPKVVEDYFRKVFSVYFYKPADQEQLTINFTHESALSGRKVAEIFGSTYLANYKIDLAKIKHIPVLIVHGYNDIVPISTAISIHKGIPGSKMVTINDCDHFPYIEQPEEFFNAIQKFTD